MARGLPGDKATFRSVLDRIAEDDDFAFSASSAAFPEWAARDPEERFDATMKLSELPRNASKVRIRNRCSITGRPRAYYRKFGLSRIALRDLASEGQIPGMTKSSW